MGKLEFKKLIKTLKRIWEALPKNWDFTAQQRIWRRRYENYIRMLEKSEGEKSRKASQGN